MTSQSKTNLFRSKGDNHQPPPVPHELVLDFQNLIKTVINDGTLTLFEKLEGIYCFLDRYNSFVATFTVCQKGCAHCCQIGVSMGRLEAEYITYKCGPALNIESDITVIEIGKKIPCPFLSDADTCSVYAHRPFNCRTFHTVDNSKYCESGTDKHLVYGASSEGYGVTIYYELAKWLKEQHSSHSLPYRDIRDWFPS